MYILRLYKWVVRQKHAEPVFKSVCSDLAAVVDLIDCLPISEDYEITIDYVGD